MKTNTVFLIFPHQLFKDVEPLRRADSVCLVEETLYFNQYKFHTQKLLLHRAGMKCYADRLNTHGFKVQYTEAIQADSDVRVLIANLAKSGCTRIIYYDVCDTWLERRLHGACQNHGIQFEEQSSPMFINTKADLEGYFGSREKYFQTDFYMQQRKSRKILVDEQNKPIGGKWTFDTENRLKYPKGQHPPKLMPLAVNPFYQEAVSYVDQHFSNNPGTVSDAFRYPINHAESEAWLNDFLHHRFFDFGIYEDAMVEQETFLHHSLLSPLLNCGLLLPMQVVQAAMDYAAKHELPMNSLEGFVRQIIGWREFIRGVYVYKGSAERTKNHWGFTKKMPAEFYTAQTGMVPVDTAIRRVMDTAYCHHIERLMVLGNTMLLAEIHPDAVYQWFMELFIDAYDWVMVPNVYGMSQFADGGLMATKPYISGSSYIHKMSDYKKAAWSEVWDALFWRFMDKHRTFFLSNPRLGMLIKTYDKMGEEKKRSHKQALDAVDWL